MTTFMVATLTGSKVPGRDAPSGPPAYSPEWVALCYGLEPDGLGYTGESPRVTIDFPDWANLAATAGMTYAEVDEWVAARHGGAKFTVAEANRHSLREGPA